VQEEKEEEAEENDQGRHRVGWAFGPPPIFNPPLTFRLLGARSAGGVSYGEGIILAVLNTIFIFSSLPPPPPGGPGGGSGLSFS
jgi:hypothetical protein